MRIEAVLVFRRDGLDGRGETVLLGKTEAADVVQTLAHQLVADAEAVASMWEGIDPAIGAVAAAEAERVARVMEAILPEPADADSLRILTLNDQQRGAERTNPRITPDPHP